MHCSQLQLCDDFPVLFFLKILSWKNLNCHAIWRSACPLAFYWEVLKVFLLMLVMIYFFITPFWLKIMRKSVLLSKMFSMAHLEAIFLSLCIWFHEIHSALTIQFECLFTREITLYVTLKIEKWLSLEPYFWFPKTLQFWFGIVCKTSHLCFLIPQHWQYLSLRKDQCTWTSSEGDIS